uniref:C-type lectin domain-containing protein n=3 Tax=Magallana gigas TaxID=29159 RepID=A0A8W8HYY5_MAGGI|nr:perlucin-like protein isoform X3 [Crassostrea gigas]
MTSLIVSQTTGFSMTLIIGCILFLLDIAFGCPPGWTTFNTSCYHLSIEEESWVDSMKMCEIHGAYLVHINSASEDTFITNQMITNGVKELWLGGSDWNVEGVWVWEPEGDLFQYSNFDHDEPDNYGDDENCVRKEQSAHYRWNDKPCDHRYSYICETSNKVGNPALG